MGLGFQHLRLAHQTGFRYTFVTDFFMRPLMH